MTEQQLTVFLECSARFERIVATLPIELRNGKRHGGKWDPDNIKEQEVQLRRVYLSYFNLCSEEFLLMRKGLVLKEVWKHWSWGIATIMETRSARDAWQHLRVQYDSFQAFVKFMDGLCDDQVRSSKKS